MKKTAMAVTLGAAFLLAGCSSEPSESDIANAIKAAIDASNAQVQKLAGNSPMANNMKVEFISARKISCSESGTKDKINCEVEVETRAPMVGQQKVTRTVPFVNDNGDWKVVL